MTTSVISVPMRKDLSVSRVTTSRRATSSQACSVGSLPVEVVWLWPFRSCSCGDLPVDLRQRGAEGCELADLAAVEAGGQDGAADGVGGCVVQVGDLD